MNILPDSWPLWIGAAIALFWFVGAHNRLVRLRSAALQAYAPLDAALQQQLDFVLARVAQTTGASAATPAADDAPLVEPLQAAASQFTHMLVATRAHPLDPQAMAALTTAAQVLRMVWERQPPALAEPDASGTPATAVANAAASTAVAPLETLPASALALANVNPPALVWPDAAAATMELARAHFNQTVLHYNDAIREFPALLVAWLFQLRPAAGLL